MRDITHVLRDITQECGAQEYGSAQPAFSLGPFMAGALHPVGTGGNAMADTKELIVTLDGRRRVTAHVGSHQIRTDQPVSNGGEDSAPSPFDVFLASLGTCAGIFVQGFCAARGIDTRDIRIHEWPRYDAQGTLKSVELAIDLPVDYPARYREPLLRVVEQCSVKRAIAAKPEFLVRIGATPEAAAVAAHHAISK